MNLLEKKKKYYENNKEKYKEKITCECGCNITFNRLAPHMKTKRHNDLMAKKA